MVVSGRLAEGAFLGCTASMGAPLCVGAPQRGVRRVVEVGLVSVSSVWLAAVFRVSSSAAPHGSCLFACLALLFFFSGGGGGWGAVRGCGCVSVPAAVWAWVSWGTGVGLLLRSGYPVCAPAPRLPVSKAPVQGVLTAGGWRQWWRGACVGGRGSWVVPGWRARVWACVWVCSWRGLMGWWAVWALLFCVGVGYVCAEGAVGWAGALWAIQWVEEMLVTPTGGGAVGVETGLCC